MVNFPVWHDDVLNMLDPGTRARMRILINEAGIALAGACPGTTLAQIGVGYRDAIFTLLGGLAGAVAFSYAQPWLAGSLIGTGPKLIFTDLAGVPYWQGALALAVAIVVILVLMERLRPWRKDLGTDVDGNGAEKASQPRSRLAPAEHHRVAVDERRHRLRERSLHSLLHLPQREAGARA